MFPDQNLIFYKNIKHRQFYSNMILMKVLMCLQSSFLGENTLHLYHKKDNQAFIMFSKICMEPLVFISIGVTLS